MIKTVAYKSCTSGQTDGRTIVTSACMASCTQRNRKYRCMSNDCITGRCLNFRQTALSSEDVGQWRHKADTPTRERDVTLTSYIRVTHLQMSSTLRSHGHTFLRPTPSPWSDTQLTPHPLPSFSLGWLFLCVKKISRYLNDNLYILMHINKLEYYDNKCVV